MFLAGCGQKIRAADLDSLSIAEGVRVVNSQDGMMTLGVPVAARDTILRPIVHLPKDLSLSIGTAYGVKSSEEGVRHLLTLRYDEATLPLGVDEADLVLGRVVENRWEIIGDSVVSVVSNTVRGVVLSSRATDIYGLLTRPHPEFSDPSFDHEVLSGTPSTGWVSETHAPEEGGRRNVGGNHLFLIKDNGQVHSDPSVRQTVSGFVPGRTYIITGLFEGVVTTTHESAPSFGVAVDGQVILERSRPLEEGLTPFSATLQATATSHEIAFIAERNGSPTAYFIDDVGITSQRGFPLHVAKVGSGQGGVLSHPHGIDCGQTCSEFFASGRSITLVATAEQGSVFSGFSNDVCPERPVCTLTLDAAKTITATFSTASRNANLAHFEARPNRNDAEVAIKPDFTSNQTNYDLIRLGRPGFVTFLAKTEDSEAVIRMGEKIQPSGQPVRVYFNGADTRVPILVTAQDGETTKQYVVRLCRWYCVNPPSARGEEEVSLTKGGVL